ncbi:MAG: hypothetical protein U0931_28980 [Vulcanimicrobiota bacterium]
MKITSKQKSKLKQVATPQNDYIPPTPVKRPPPTLFLFHNQIGLGYGFQGSNRPLG